MRTITRAITTTGSAGSATGAATIKGARGLLARIALNWHGSAPDTSDVAIVESWDGGSKTLYSSSNDEADYDKPNVEESNEANQFIPIALIGGTITITVAQSDALTNALIVTLAIVD